MKRLFVLALAVSAGVALAVGVVLAGFLSQTTSATLSMATSDEPTLYICEPRELGGAVVAGPDCGKDDDGTKDGPPGPDEVIFEDDENAVPGSIRFWDIRLRNTGVDAWDLFPAIDTIDPVDPAEDCTVKPEVSLVRILGKVAASGFNDPLSGATYDTVNDNHSFAGGNVPGAAFFWLETFTSQYYVHVAPGDYEDLRIRVSFPTTAGEECVGSEWTLTIDWNVGVHS